MAWWYGQNEERWNHQAPTREDAISEGRAMFPGEDFLIVQAEQGNFDLRVNIDDLWDLFENQNEENIDPDGDEGVKDRMNPTGEQEADLEAALNATILTWCERHKIDTTAWAFKEQGRIETIPAEQENENGDS